MLNGSALQARRKIQALFIPSLEQTKVCSDVRPIRLHGRGGDVDQASAEAAFTPSPSTATPSPLVGRADTDARLPAFRAQHALGRIIGCGAFSTVRTATRRADGRVIAVKVVHGSDEKQRRATVSEYELMRTLKHRAIVCAEGLYQTSSSMWLVMELLEGGDVDMHVGKRGPFGEGPTLSLSLQLLGGVDYCHSKRVVHRDIKPSNILLEGRAASAKLADFNSATVIGTGAAPEDGLTFRGTRVYCAPELLLDWPWDERIDIWACGLCFYFMNQAALPYDVGSSCILASFVAGKLPDIRWGGVPPKVSSLVSQCLVVDRNQRPTASVISSQLVEFRSGAPGAS
mmetsp:Transcript_23230/g.64964  ORF Transcript_23230/g.64964 Transcript_23230/m.64964 type:complete len:343 (-) Transcript_23230:245-1273(-)